MKASVSERITSIGSRDKRTYLYAQPDKTSSRSTQPVSDLEVDQSAFAPEVQQPGLERPVGSGLEDVSHTRPPFPHPEDDTPKEVDTNQTASNRMLSTKRFFLITFVTLLVLAIALGIGLGVGLHRQDNSSDDQTVTGPPSSPTPSTVPLVHGALNDTSLAAVSFNGDRYLFFQDINSTVRYKRYSASANSWLPSNIFITSGSAPKSNTPIAAAVSNSTLDHHNVIYVFYIALNDTLAVGTYDPTESSATMLEAPVLNSSFSALPSSRSLSVLRLLSDELFLFFESSNGNLTVLHGLYHFFDTEMNGKSNQWIWQNISEHFYPQNIGESYGGWLGSPFSATTLTLPGDSGSTYLEAVFFNPASLHDAASPAFLQIALSNFTNTGNFQSSGLLPVMGQTPLSNSAIVSTLSDGNTDIGISYDYLATTYGPAVVYNGTLYNADHGSQWSEFPFGRMAYIWGNESSYYYHQLNHTHLIEELSILNDGQAEWATPKYIVVSTDDT